MVHRLGAVLGSLGVGFGCVASACGGQLNLGDVSPSDGGGHADAADAPKDAARPDAGPAPLDWHEVSSTGPSTRIQASMVYDSDRKVTVLFGGMDTASGDALSDTWEWNGTKWTRQSPPTSPPARLGSALGYDSARRVAVLFSGDIDDLPPPPIAADTWEWNGTTWTQRSPPTSPPPVQFGAMAFDSRRDVAVLYLGYTGLDSGTNDTWEWDGTTWAQRAAATYPPPRTEFALAYDSDHASTILFGGIAIASGDGPVVMLGDGWNWNGTSWAKMQPASRPPPARSGHAMVYDVARARTVLFGGEDAAANELNDTWEYDGAVWSEASPATRPPPTTQHAMAYDSDRHVTVMFGGDVVGGDGYPDTWELSAP
jgi:hypothetical protein